MNKKQENNNFAFDFAVTFSAAARRLGVSISTVQRLARKGALHTTEPQLRRHHWTRGIRVDEAFEAERARRKNGLKAPRGKHIPDTESVQREFERKAREERMNEICEQRCKEDQSGIQAITDDKKNELTQAAMLERAENAMHICLEAQKACDKDMQECRSRAAECKGGSAHVDEATSYVAHAKVECWSRERACTCCTAILATACILQALLAVYYTLCHLNII